MIEFPIMVVILTYALALVVILLPGPDKKKKDE